MYLEADEITMIDSYFSCRVHEGNQTCDGQPVKESGDKDHRDQRWTCEWHEKCLHKLLSFHMKMMIF